MNLEDRINLLHQYKKAIIAWDKANNDQEKATLRTFINQNTQAVKHEVQEARCYKKMTIGPPPAVGGILMSNICPFDIMFDCPYSLSLVPCIVDMIEQAVGVMSSSDYKTKMEESIYVSQNFKVGYAFVAMPIDPDDPALEYVLASIKEVCSCNGVNAERVDESPSSERITDRILESIRRAEFVIVDLTSSKPNVYYEAGYAQGQGKTPIYVAKNGTNLEFDLKDYPVIFFKNMRQLKEELEKRLRHRLQKRAES